MSEPCPFEQAEAAGRITAPEYFSVTREQYENMQRFVGSLVVKTEPPTYTPLESWEGALLLDAGAQEQQQTLPEHLMSYVLHQLKKSGYEMCRRDPR